MVWFKRKGSPTEDNSVERVVSQVADADADADATPVIAVPTLDSIDDSCDDDDDDDIPTLAQIGPYAIMGNSNLVQNYPYFDAGPKEQIITARRRKIIEMLALKRAMRYDPVDKVGAEKERKARRMGLMDSGWDKGVLFRYRRGELADEALNEALNLLVEGQIPSTLTPSGAAYLVPAEFMEIVFPEDTEAFIDRRGPEVVDYAKKMIEENDDGIPMLATQWVQSVADEPAPIDFSDEFDLAMITASSLQPIDELPIGNLADTLDAAPPVEVQVSPREDNQLIDTGEVPSVKLQKVLDESRRAADGGKLVEIK